MTERIDSTQLVFIPSKWSREEAGTLTRGQQEIVTTQAIAYLKRAKIPFNSTNLKLAIEVLAVDALPRGRLLGQSEGKKQSGLILLINRGLRHRDDIKDLTIQAVREIKMDFGKVDNNGPIGPYAISQAMVDKVDQILFRFSLEADISPCDEICQLYLLRKPLLPLLASFAVDSLPREHFPQASIDRFPEAADQGRIVRNSILSYAARDSILPIITIEELRSFLEQGKFTDLSSRDIGDKLFAFFLENTAVNQVGLRDYLIDLTRQTIEGLRKIEAVKLSERGKSELEMITIRDALYRYYNNFFLLLHPALEEKRIVINPADYTPEGYSLWREGWGVKIKEGIIVPSPEALTRAARLFEAKNTPTTRFVQGVHAWKDYERQLPKEREQIAILQKQLADIENKLTRLAQGDQIAKPAVIYSLVYAWRNEGYRDYLYLKREYRKMIKIISDNDKMREVGDEVLRLLRKKDGSYPETAPVPQFIYESRVLYETAVRRHRHSTADTRLEKAVQAMEEDYVSKLRSRTREIDWLFVETEELAQELKYLTEELKRKEPPSDLTIDLGDVRAFIESYQEKLKIRVLGRKGYWLPGDPRRLEELRKVGKIVSDALFGLRPNSEAIKSFYLFCLKNQISCLEEMIIAKEDKKVHLEAPAVSEKWERSEIEEFERKLKVITLDRTSLSPDTPEQYEQIKWWWGNFTLPNRRIKWPNFILPRDEFIKWTNEEIIKLREKVQRSPAVGISKVRTMGLAEEKSQILQGLKKLINLPLFPLDEVAGMRTDDFWYAMSKRLELLRSICGIKQAEANYELGSVVYQRLVREVHQKYLEGKKLGLIRRIEELKSEPAKQEIVKKMRDLSLAVFSQQ